MPSPLYHFDATELISNKNTLFKLAPNFIYNFAIAQITMPPVATAILTIFIVPAGI
ncbi:MAG: hypothetical protein JGK01_27740, partial [Microcoleus sp. PH2017_03_ELD_O_A]|nr:hypothetical protein [Microcoleus sp. PH2017_03_ELD_O_A]